LTNITLTFKRVYGIKTLTKMRRTFKLVGGIKNVKNAVDF